MICSLCISPSSFECSLGYFLDVCSHCIASFSYFCATKIFVGYLQSLHCTHLVICVPTKILSEFLCAHFECDTQCACIPVLCVEVHSMGTLLYCLRNSSNLLQISKFGYIFQYFILIFIFVHIPVLSMCHIYTCHTLVDIVDHMIDITHN